MALMSVGFLYYIAPVENEQGVSSTEIRVAIFLGGLVAAVAIAYEFYSKKKETDSIKQPTDDKLSEPTQKPDTPDDSDLSTESKDTKES